MRYIIRNAFKTKRYRHDRNDDLYIPDRSTFLRFEDITRRNAERYKKYVQIVCLYMFQQISFHFYTLHWRIVSICFLSIEDLSFIRE